MHDGDSWSSNETITHSNFLLNDQAQFSLLAELNEEITGKIITRLVG